MNTHTSVSIHFIGDILLRKGIISDNELTLQILSVTAKIPSNGEKTTKKRL